MKENFEYLKDELKNNNIRLSHQRLKVLEYLSKNKSHPTVDEIYNNLKEEVPTLSKTTIYNTLNTLVEVSLVKIINIEDKEARYDADVADHGHFKCTSCETVFDFNLNFDSILPQGLDDFKVENKDIYFKGLCPSCKHKKTNKIQEEIYNGE